MKFESFTKNYFEKLQNALNNVPLQLIEKLKNSMLRAWTQKNQLFIFGNGGSGGNAIHLANDYLYGVGKGNRPGLKVHALTANPSVLTCLANDVGYENIFTEQLKAFSNKDDIALAFSGSGNSPNVVKAISWAKDNGIKTLALAGGQCGKITEIADESLIIDSKHYGHVEDAQMTIAHILCYAFMENDDLVD